MKKKNLKKFTIDGVDYFFTIDNKSSWEYLIFPSEINDINNKAIQNLLINHYTSENSVEVYRKAIEIMKRHIRDKDNILLNKELSNFFIENRKFYDVLVISIDNLLDKDSKSAFIFFQGFTQLIAQQPFILFLTKKDNNPNVLTLFQFITNEYFDKRNVFAYKFPENNDEKMNINNFFINSMNYYHAVGDNINNSHLQTFNILICGPAGVGKSTFINQFLQEKRAKEGEGLPATHEITSYVHSKYPIRIFDTPGFEGDETVAMLRKTLDRFEKDIKDSKNHFDLIIYFCKINPRTFYESEIRLIEYLIEKNKKIIFVCNNFGYSKVQCNKYLYSIQQSIKEIAKLKYQKNLWGLEEILNGITLINLKQTIYEDEEEEKLKIIQCYGMDRLFQKIYELFKNDKIMINEVNCCRDINEMYNIIKKYRIIEYLCYVIDININIKIEISKLILSYSKYDGFVFFF